MRVGLDSVALEQGEAQLFCRSLKGYPCTNAQSNSESLELVDLAKASPCEGQYLASQQGRL